MDANTLEWSDYQPSEYDFDWGMWYAGGQFVSGWTQGQPEAYQQGLADGRALAKYDCLGNLSSLSSQLDTKLAAAQTVLNQVRCIAAQVTPNAPASWCVNASSPAPAPQIGTYTVGNCQNGPVTATCPTGQVISGGTVKYGRWDNTACPHSTVTASTPAKSSMFPLPADATGKSSYTMADATGFSDPYPGVFKQYELNYACVPQYRSADK